MALFFLNKCQREKSLGDISESRAWMRSKCLGWPVLTPRELVEPSDKLSTKFSWRSKQSTKKHFPDETVVLIRGTVKPKLFWSLADSGFELKCKVHPPLACGNLQTAVIRNKKLSETFDFRKKQSSSSSLVSPGQAHGWFSHSYTGGTRWGLHPGHHSESGSILRSSEKIKIKTSMPPVLRFVCDRRQHLHMPKDCFPKLTCLMPSFGTNTTPRWSHVHRNYCTRKYPRRTCHHIVSAPHPERTDAGLSKGQEKDKWGWKRHWGAGGSNTQGKLLMGKAPTQMPGASTAQLRLQLVLDQIRKEHLEVGTLSLCLSSELSCDNSPAQGTFTQSLKVLTLLMGHDGT